MKPLKTLKKCLNLMDLRLSMRRLIKDDMLFLFIKIYQECNFNFGVDFGCLEYKPLRRASLVALDPISLQFSLIL